jgi:hypothetical protein
MQILTLIGIGCALNDDHAHFRVPRGVGGLEVYLGKVSQLLETVQFSSNVNLALGVF